MRARPPPPRLHPTSTQAPVAFLHTLCPYAERVWLALLEKGVPFHLVHIDLANKPAWYRRINPRGLVPAVQQHGGQVHVESADICRWGRRGWACCRGGGRRSRAGALGGGRRVGGTQPLVTQARPHPAAGGSMLPLRGRASSPRTQH